MGHWGNNIYKGQISGKDEVTYINGWWEWHCASVATCNMCILGQLTKVNRFHCLLQCGKPFQPYKGTSGLGLKHPNGTSVLGWHFSPTMKIFQSYENALVLDLSALTESQSWDWVTLGHISPEVSQYFYMSILHIKLSKSCCLTPMSLH